MSSYEDARAMRVGAAQGRVFSCRDAPGVYSHFRAVMHVAKKPRGECPSLARDAAERARTPLARQVTHQVEKVR